MSVLALDPEVFNYIRVGIERASYNNTIDEFYFSSIKSHNRQRDIEKECLRLVRSWAALNYESYGGRYNETTTDIQPFINPTFTHKPLKPVQLLKYVQCLIYNIETEHVEMTDQKQADLKLLNQLERDILGAIVGSMKEYKEASWSELN